MTRVRQPLWRDLLDDPAARPDLAAGGREYVAYPVALGAVCEREPKRLPSRGRWRGSVGSDGAASVWVTIATRASTGRSDRVSGSWVALLKHATSRGMGITQAGALAPTVSVA
jgi:hypothetical protein